MITTSPAELIAAALRPAEGGYYVVMLNPDAANISASTMAEAAERVRLKPAELSRIFEAGQCLPLVRLASAEAAALVKDELQAFGVDGAIVSHAELQLDSAPKKVRALEISDQGLTASVTTSPEMPTARWEDVILLVVGRLIANRVEVEPRRKRGRNQPVDTRQLSSDETVLDLYIGSESINWRIIANSFDFSCLGAARSVTAYENFTALVGVLRQRAANASFDDSYARARPALAAVWPVEPKETKGEWRRSGAGKFDMATVTTTDNEDQFTRYSRLRHWLKLRAPEIEK
jgi:hypothetical protein